MARESPDRSATSILVVDDEWLLRAALVDLIEESGFDAFEAEDASAALALLKLHDEIGIVITDIQMPGAMDGLALARYIRESYPPIRLIVASGAVRPSATDLPDDAIFLPKPFDLAALAELLRSLRAP